MKPIFKYTVLALLIAISVTFFYKKVYIKKTTFELISPTKGHLDVIVSGIGNVSAKFIYSITAQSGGKILKILKDEGKWVKKGELLITMDGVDLPKQLEIIKATLKKVKYDLLASKNELKNQESQKELIQKTFNRYAKLNKQGYVAQSEYDKAFTDLQTINSTILVSKSHVDSAKVQIVISEKNIDALKIKIDNLKVYSPVDGYIISKSAETAQNVLPTTTILQIVDPKTLWINSKIDERVSATIKVNQKAHITLSSQPDKKYEAIVKRILPVSDAITLEREVDVAFVNIPKPFYINEQAEVSIDTKSYQNIIKIPLMVLVEKDSKLGVWILTDNHAHFKIIKKIAQNSTEVAVSNININSKIIVPNHRKKTLTEGMRIHL